MITFFCSSHLSSVSSARFFETEGSPLRSHNRHNNSAKRTQVIEPTIKTPACRCQNWLMLDDPGDWRPLEIQDDIDTVFNPETLKLKTRVAR